MDENEADRNEEWYAEWQDKRKTNWLEGFIQNVCGPR